MNKIKTITKLDFRTLKYCNLFLMKFKRRSKLWIIVTVVLSAGIIAYDILVPKTRIFAVLGGLFIAYSIYQFFSLEKKLDQQLAGFFRGRPVTTQTVEIDEESVKVTRSLDPENPIEYDWSYINQIYEMPQYYMLMVGKGIPIIIDRSEEALLEGTKESLDAIIQEKAQLKPYKKTEEDLAKRPITFVHEEFPSAEAVEVEAEETAGEETAEEAEVVDTVDQEPSETQDGEE
ncbi:MAG: hypothetical protein WBK54_01775 [Bacilli bacterium]|jgi:hypothetical protein|nr:hypothetical protein [Acholeplasmataceae bacterium]